MNGAEAIKYAKDNLIPDEEVVRRVRSGETALFEIIMRRYNQRLYRVARAILGDDGGAEDVMQETYVRAYMHLDQFSGQAKFSTWLTKIAVHEALARARRNRSAEISSISESDEERMSSFKSAACDPERQAYAHELRALLEAAVEALPEVYRTVFMLREVEGMSTSETAECLGISEEAVKVRLHRARALLRKELYERTGATTMSAFQFAGSRCDRVVSAVLDRIGSFGELRA